MINRRIVMIRVLVTGGAGARYVNSFSFANEQGPDQFETDLVYNSIGQSISELDGRDESDGYLYA